MYAIIYTYIMLISQVTHPYYMYIGLCVYNTLCGTVAWSDYLHLSVGESGGYLPRRFAAWEISTTIHLHFGE